jgi:hypothetical protein
VSEGRGPDGSACRLFFAPTPGAANPEGPADVAAPIGVLNFFDLATFLGWYNAGDPRADLALPAGVFNFFDISTYIGRFNLPCP